MDQTCDLDNAWVNAHLVPILYGERDCGYLWKQFKDHTKEELDWVQPSN